MASLPYPWEQSGVSQREGRKEGMLSVFKDQFTLCFLLFKQTKSTSLKFNPIHSQKSEV
jgi:hypothetical protein